MLKNMKNNILIIILTGTVFLTGCSTYNIPSGSTTPLISKQGESKLSAAANFNEAGASFTYALTNHVLFTTSGILSIGDNPYKQDYDSVFFRKTPNNFEVGFGYFESYKKFVNNAVFGIGTGNAAYRYGTQEHLEGYYQTEYVQYFLQYNAGFKYEKKRRRHIRFKEQGLSLRYAYHNYHVSGISNDVKFEEIWNEEYGYYDYIDYIVSSTVEETNNFNSFTVYYFYRTGNDKIQFEISPGLSFYDKEPKYGNNILTSVLHFNVGLVFNLNKLFIKN